MHQVRNACREDLPGIASIEQSCFHVPLEPAQLEALFGSESVVMLCTGEEPAGYVSMQTVLDEGYINNIAVLSEYRRRGLARALLNALEGQGREMELAFITLEVRQSNLGAIALYEGCGYKQIGLRKNYYEKPKENAIIMTKFLK